MGHLDVERNEKKQNGMEKDEGEKIRLRMVPKNISKKKNLI